MHLQDNLYMDRCADLARLGRGGTKTNPCVGSLLTLSGEIVGEGYHRRFGQAHAEVNALADVPGQLEQIADARMYVTLEPCSHQGKTPPCCEQIEIKAIKSLVIAQEDPNPTVSGRGINRLRSAGAAILLLTGHGRARQVLHPFRVIQRFRRPYIILKWAESVDGFLAQGGQRTKISGPLADRLVHKWRSESDAILVGTNTVQIDNPQLSNRLYHGTQPTRVVIDRHGRLSADAKVFDGSQATMLFSYDAPPVVPDGVQAYVLPEGSQELSFILTELLRQDIGAVLVEGGAQLLRSFLEAGLWDECRVITSSRPLASGVKAPYHPTGTTSRLPLGEDYVTWYMHDHSGLYAR